MVRSKLFTAVSMFALLSGSTLAPIAAHADDYGRGNGSSLQTQKNDWRNAAIVSGAVALYGLATHQRSAAIVGTIGTVVAVSQFDRDQRIQNDRNCRQNGYIGLRHNSPEENFGWNQSQRGFGNGSDGGHFDSGRESGFNGDSRRNDDHTGHQNNDWLNSHNR